MKKLAEKLVESMMKYGTLSNEDKGIYVFGIYQTMVSALEILLMLVTVFYAESDGSASYF